MEFTLPDWAGQWLVIGGISFGVIVMGMLKKIADQSKRLLMMHESPDEFGFGTGGQNGRLDKLVQCAQDQTYWLKAMANALSEKGIMPPIHDPDR